MDFGEFHSHMALCRKGGFNVLIIRSVKKEEQIQQLAELASQIWNEYFVEVLSKEQITYMVEKFQSVSAITEQIQEGYHYYFIIYIFRIYKKMWHYYFLVIIEVT